MTATTTAAPDATTATATAAATISTSTSTSTSTGIITSPAAAAASNAEAVPPSPLRAAAPEESNGNASVAIIGIAIAVILVFVALVVVVLWRGGRCKWAKGDCVLRIPRAALEFTNIQEASTGSTDINSMHRAKHVGKGSQERMDLPQSPHQIGADSFGEDEVVVAIPNSQAPELLVSPSNVTRYMPSLEPEEPAATAGVGAGAGVGAVALGSLQPPAMCEPLPAEEPDLPPPKAPDRPVSQDAGHIFELGPEPFELGPEAPAVLPEAAETSGELSGPPTPGAPPTPRQPLLPDDLEAGIPDAPVLPRRGRIMESL